MLGLNPSMRFYLCEGPVDMRKGIFTLAELVRKIMGKEPSTGDIFIFLSKDRRNIKILHHDTGGYVLYWKKLDKDRFRQSLGGVVEAYEAVAHRLGVKLD